jgi:hypothetical protein
VIAIGFTLDKKAKIKSFKAEAGLDVILTYFTK